MISISKQKEIIIPQVEKYLSEKGFIQVKNDEILFLKNSEHSVIKISFYFSKSGFSGNTLFAVAFKEIEDIIYRAGLANNPNIIEESKYQILTTIYDYNSPYSYTDKPLKIGSTSHYERVKIDTQDKLYQWIEAFGDYCEREGKKFLKHYSSIESLNLAIKDLNSIGEKNFSKILYGGIDHMFRALIITRLCKDTLYGELMRRYDSILAADKYVKWHSHYRKLKLILENMDSRQSG